MRRLILRAAVAAALLALSGVSAAHANPDIHLVWPYDHTTTPTTLTCGGTANHWATIRVVFYVPGDGGLEGLQEVRVVDDMGHHGPVSDYGPFQDTPDPASLPCGWFPGADGDWSVDWMTTIGCGPNVWHNNSHTLTAFVGYFVVTYYNPETGEESREYYTASNSQAFPFSKLVVSNATAAPHARFIMWDPATLQSVTLACATQAAGHFYQEVIYDIRDPVTHALIRTLTHTHTAPGSDSVVWDGKNAQGQDVPRGVYVYEIRTETNSGGQGDSEKSRLLSVSDVSAQLTAYDDQTKEATVEVNYTLNDWDSFAATGCEVVVIDPEFQEQPPVTAPTNLGPQNVPVNVTLNKAGTWYFMVCPTDYGGTRDRAHADHPALQRGATRFVSIDLDVDSDNNNGVSPPDRSSAEDAMEDDVQALGKTFPVNDADGDDDGLAGFFDGFSAFPDDPDAVLDSDARFVPVVLELPRPIDPAAARVRFTYDGSDPAGVVRQGAAPDCTHKLPEELLGQLPGRLRIWTKNGNVARNRARVDSGGDYVPPGVPLDASVLGFNSSTRTVTMYVEGIRLSAAKGDCPIRVDVDPDGAGPQGFIFTDTVRTAVGPYDVEIMAIGEDGTIGATMPTVPISHPHPTFEVNIAELGLTLAEGASADVRIDGELHIKGKVHSGVCDIIPEGQISSISLFVNVPDGGDEGDPDEPISVPLDVTKSSDGSRPRYHPYEGTFDLVVPLEDLDLGPNIFRLEAVDPIPVDPANPGPAPRGVGTYEFVVNVEPVNLEAEPVLLQASAVEVVYADTEEDFRPLAVRVMGIPEVLAGSGFTVPTCMGPLPVYKEGESYYVADPGGAQRPAVFLALLDPAGVSPAPDPKEPPSPPEGGEAGAAINRYGGAMWGQWGAGDAVMSAPLDSAKFLAGFGVGFLEGGANMVTGVGSALMTVLRIQAAVQTAPGQIALRLVTDRKKLLRDARATAESVRRAGEVILAIRDEADATIEGLLVGDPATTETVSTGFRIILEYSADFLSKMWEDWTDPDPYKAGRSFGRAVFEVASLAAPAGDMAQVTKLTKGEFLGRIANANFLTRYPRAAEEVTALRAGMAATSLCLARGTPVITDCGVRNIETVQRGARVLSRDPTTGQQDYRRVLDTIVSHPGALYHLQFRLHRARESRPRSSGGEEDGGEGGDTGEGDSEAEISCTAGHPFWVVERGEFVPAAALCGGEHLLLASGATAVVDVVTRQDAAPGEGFTTYNLQVEGFHTYFAGEGGVWTHNACNDVCRRIYSVYRYLRARKGKQAWEAFEWILQRMPKASGQVLGKTAGVCMDEAYAAAAAAQPANLSLVPTYTRIKDVMADRNGIYLKYVDWTGDPTLDGVLKSVGTQLQLESHHSVPRYVQRKLGIGNPTVQDGCPGYLTTLLEHRGKGPRTIHNAIRDRIPYDATGLTNTQIRDLLEEAYGTVGCPDVWIVAKEWLTTQGVP